MTTIKAQGPQLGHPFTRARFPGVCLSSHPAYMASLQKAVRRQLRRFYPDGIPNMHKITQDRIEIVKYPHMDRIDPNPPIENIPSQNFPYPQRAFRRRSTWRDILGETFQKTQEAILAGEILFEHTAAGSASRINTDLARQGRNPLGYKFFFMPGELAAAIDKTSEFSNLYEMSLGVRHMLAMSFVITQLARAFDKNPQDALEAQHVQIIANTATIEDTLLVFKEWGYFGLDPAKVYFSVEERYPGIGIHAGEVFIDPFGIAEVHNHGIIRMQNCMEGQLFRTDGSNLAEGARDRLSRKEYREILAARQDLVSYPIEDLGYLDITNLRFGMDPYAGPFEDFVGFAIALHLGRRGYNMIMEVTPQKPYKPAEGIVPQKGGMLAYDRGLGRLVMIESFRLGKEYDHKDRNEALQIYLKIRWLNRNFNHYPNPADSFDAITQQGLPITIEIKGDHIFNACPQGDVNLIVPTAFFAGTDPFVSLKRYEEIRPTLKAFAAMDQNPEFLAFAAEFRDIG